MTSQKKHEIVLRSQAEKEETVRMIEEELRERMKGLPELLPWQLEVIDKIFRDLRFTTKPKGWIP